jgi:hypothetical protein
MGSGAREFSASCGMELQLYRGRRIIVCLRYKGAITTLSFSFQNHPGFGEHNLWHFRPWEELPLEHDLHLCAIRCFLFGTGHFGYSFLRMQLRLFRIEIETSIKVVWLRLLLLCLRFSLAYSASFCIRHWSNIKGFVLYGLAGVIHLVAIPGSLPIGFNKDCNLPVGGVRV